MVYFQTPLVLRCLAALRGSAIDCCSVPKVTLNLSCCLGVADWRSEHDRGREDRGSLMGR